MPTPEQPHSGHVYRWTPPSDAEAVAAAIEAAEGDAFERAIRDPTGVGCWTAPAGS